MLSLFLSGFWLITVSGVVTCCCFVPAFLMEWGALGEEHIHRHDIECECEEYDRKFAGIARAMKHSCLLVWSCVCLALLYFKS